MLEFHIDSSTEWPSINFTPSEREVEIQVLFDLLEIDLLPEIIQGCLNEEVGILVTIWVGSNTGVAVTVTGT